MATSSIDTGLQSELAAVAESQGLELLELSFQRGTLRLILDRVDGAVTLEDCQTVSKLVSPVLDLHEFGGERRYFLEVSSPGLDRKLYGPRDYRRFAGSLARVTYFAGEDRSKQTVVGRLERFDEDAPGGGVLHLHDEEADRRTLIPVADIKLARLEIEI